LPFFQEAKLNPTAMNALMDRIVEKTFHDSQDIFGDDVLEMPCLYFVRSGTIEVTTKNPDGTKIVSAGEVFGNSADDNNDDTSNATTPDENKFPSGHRRRAGMTATAMPGSEPVVCGILDWNDVELVKNIPDEKEESFRPEESPFLARRAELRVSVKSGIRLEDLERISLLGEGQFGEVWLVAADVFQTGIDELKQKFALKSQYKTDDIRQDEATDAIRREIEMINAIQHPGILDLVNTYEDESSIYMLMGLIPGGELWDVLHKEDDAGNWSSGVSEEHAKFYTLVVADTLAYMHSRHYVFRDLKPENVMIDAEGYPVIIDFGFAKYCEDKTYTFCGTPNYVAPEIVKNSGHNAGVDHWALGVLVYEMITGENPFHFDGMDQVALFEAICYEDYYAISSEKSPSQPLLNLVSGLLEKDPAQRLGMLAGGSKDIIHHKWFEGMNLEKLRSKEIRAPWRPVEEEGDMEENNEDNMELNEIMELAEEEDEDDANEEARTGLMTLSPPILDASILELTVHEEEEEEEEEGEDDDDHDAHRKVPGNASPAPMEGPSPVTSTPLSSKEKLSVSSNPASPPLAEPDTPSSTQPKKKFSASPRAGLTSPYRQKKATKEEKERSSKERKATISGALLATLADMDDSF
jgi:protein kinase A